ncbi:MAG: 4Fe-4S binding protein [Clostridiales Family XIII bacterium]|jgi:aldehyde:ferredoxin oxidoreductase|nr:4Fe-4S binding protein [Clostridiales Family XIII bacterium]
MSYHISDTCIGCSACALNCPVFAIDGARGERFHINGKRCVSCGVCGRVCPQGAITAGDGSVPERVKKTEWPRPVIDSEACTACGLCRDICTKGALRIAAPKFRGDIHVAAELSEPAKCVGCGLCAKICPVGAVAVGDNGASVAEATVAAKKRKMAKPAGKPAGLRLPVYAHIDLSTFSVDIVEISEACFRKYIGGKTLAARLLLDYLPRGAGALDPAAVVIINTGPLNGTGAPSTSRFNMTFKHVVSGGIASSNCGGAFGMMLKRAGYDGLIITGRAEAPSRIEITDGDIRLLPADELWGLDVEETQEKLPAHHAKFVIGPAGENGVVYAGVVSGERIAGRCGGGAVLGSKNLKALTCYGTRPVFISDRENFGVFIRRWVDFVRSHPMTGEALPRYGSAGLVNKANTNFAMPTHNFKRGHDAEADAVSGETLAETKLERNGACVSCPIRCERRVKVGDREVKGPEYETLGLFGPNIENRDLDLIIELNYLCDIYGMDTISCAGSIAFAMELAERGVKDFGVKFGDGGELKDLIRRIALREGEAAEIANGSKWLAAKYGGEDYAIHSKGLELAAYEPRASVGMGLGYATSNRGGCHLNGGYTALFESVGVLSIVPQSPRSKAALTVFMQDSLEAVSAAGCCLFSAQTIVPAALYRLGPNHAVTRFIGKAAASFGPVIQLLVKAAPVLKLNSLYLMPHAEALALATGMKVTTGSFIELGERSYNVERLFSVREGQGAGADSLPRRLTDERQRAGDKHSVVPLAKMLRSYYRIRGWDESGAPKARILRRLKIET